MATKENQPGTTKTSHGWLDAATTALEAITTHEAMAVAAQPQWKQGGGDLATETEWRRFNTRP